MEEERITRPDNPEPTQEVAAARESVGYRVSADKTVLEKAIRERVRDFAKYTRESAEAYKTLFREAYKTYRNPAAGQLEVNRAVRSVKSADGTTEFVFTLPLTEIKQGKSGERL